MREQMQERMIECVSCSSADGASSTPSVPLETRRWAVREIETHKAKHKQRVVKDDDPDCGERSLSCQMSQLTDRLMRGDVAERQRLRDFWPPCCPSHRRLRRR